MAITGVMVGRRPRVIRPRMAPFGPRSGGRGAGWPVLMAVPGMVRPVGWTGFHGRRSARRTAGITGRVAVVRVTVIPERGAVIGGQHRVVAGAGIRCAALGGVTDFPQRIHPPAQHDGPSGVQRIGQARNEVDAENPVRLRKIVHQHEAIGGELRLKRREQCGPLLRGGLIGAVDGQGNRDALAGGRGRDAAGRMVAT